MRFKTLLHELHRRHVFKAGVAYLVVTWLLVQVLSIFIPAFEVSEELLQFAIVVMLACFPVWLIISWFYDITEDGIVRTQKIDHEEELVSTKSVNLNKVIITSLSVIVILLIVNTFRMKAEQKSVVETELVVGPDFKSSVAVLAFADMSQEKDHEYFADGMSEEIINKLAHARELKVIGRTSSFSYKNKEVTIRTIARELDVDYVLEGSVRPSKDVVRITVQLIDVKDGSHIWSDTFDRNIEDVLLTQDEIAAIVAERLKVTLLTEDLRHKKVDPEAYDLYLKAVEAINCYDEVSTLRADSLITRSLELDLNYAPSWTILSRVIFAKTYYYFLLDEEYGSETGIHAAKRAVELDSMNSGGYDWLSLFAWQNRQPEVSEYYLEKALNLAPNDPLLLVKAGNFSIRTNRLEEAHAIFNKALLLDPKNMMAFRRRGFLHWNKGNLREAEIDISKAYDLGLPDYLKNYEFSLLYRDQNRLDEATRLMELEKNLYLQKLLRCSIYYAKGRQQESIKLLEEIKASPQDVNWQMALDSEAEHHFEIACLYAYMDNADEAFVHLDKAFEHVLIWPEWLFTMPELNNLHTDPRWEEYVDRLGIEYDYDFLHRSQANLRLN